MEMKKKLAWVLAWVVSVVVASTVATNCVAQQLIPPPPVLGASPADLSALEHRLMQIEKKLDRIGNLAAACKKLSLAIYTKMFPMQMEQRVQEFGPSED